MPSTLLEHILDEWYIPEGTAFGGGRLRASSSGKAPRYLAMELGEYARGSQEARTGVNFNIGDAIHDLVRDRLAESKNFEVEHRELEVIVPGFEDVTGHIDLILTDKQTKVKWLVDIKKVDQISYIFMDPQNLKKSRYWACRNYILDTKSFENDPFKGQYLYQLATYMEACEIANIKFDRVAFLFVSPTGHLAIAEFDPTELLYHSYLDDRDINFNTVLNQPDPYKHPLCYTETMKGVPIMEAGEIHLCCQYCAYKNQCFDLSFEAKAGKPTYKLERLRDHAREY